VSRPVKKNEPPRHKDTRERMKDEEKKTATTETQRERRKESYPQMTQMYAD